MKRIHKEVAIGGIAAGIFFVFAPPVYGLSLDALYTNPLEQWTAETLLKFGILAFVSVACNFVFFLLIIDLYSKKNQLSKIYLHQIMTAKPVTIENTATLADVFELFEKKKIKALPVTDTMRLLRGIITRRDLERFRASYSDEYFLTHKHTVLSQTTVTKYMMDNVVTFRPHDTLMKAITAMSKADIGAIPVIDEQGRVQGIITHKNILDAAVKFLT